MNNKVSITIGCLGVVGIIASSAIGVHAQRVLTQTLAQQNKELKSKGIIVFEGEPDDPSDDVAFYRSDLDLLYAQSELIANNLNTLITDLGGESSGGDPTLGEAVENKINEKADEILKKLYGTAAGGGVGDGTTSGDLYTLNQAITAVTNSDANLWVKLYGTEKDGSVSGDIKVIKDDITSIQADIGDDSDTTTIKGKIKVIQDALGATDPSDPNYANSINGKIAAVETILTKIQTTNSNGLTFDSASGTFTLAKATDLTFGAVKLTDTYNTQESGVSATDGVAASGKAVQDAYKDLDTKISNKAEIEYSTIDGVPTLTIKNVQNN